MDNKFFDFNPIIMSAAETALEKAKDAFAKIDEMTEYNQHKVLNAFIENRVSETQLWGSTGYGYGDVGRELADKIVADVFGAEDAIIRYSIACGTHALGIALFALLRPGDNMLCVTGRPYDTICPVIGMDGKNGQGSLADFGVNYLQTDLDENGHLDYEAIEKAVKENKVRLVYLQRSRGYTLRDSLSVEEIGKAVKIVKENSDALVMVDNCYGEFVETEEPTSYGADLIAGSLIKNPGGGLAPTGGYIAGKAKYVELCAYRLTSVGIGKEAGASLGFNRQMYQGLFMAPHVVSQALKTAVLCSAVFDKLGFEVDPKPNDIRHDIIQSIKFGDPDKVVAFCEGIQKGAPVDSFVTPEPWDMPGYSSQVIMAAGAFVQGASIELSADAPIKPPYVAYMQGGLTYESAKLGIMVAADKMLRKGV